MLSLEPAAVTVASAGAAGAILSMGRDGGPQLWGQPGPTL